MIQRLTFSGGISHSAAAAANSNDDDRGGMASPTPSSTAQLQEMTMTMTATTIALPATIKLAGGARVLVPHGAELLPPPPSPTADLRLLLLMSCPLLLQSVGL